MSARQITIRPVRDQVVARKVEEKMTEGGLHIPDAAKEDRPRLAKVLAVGPGSRDNLGTIVPVSCKAGDTVLYRRFGGQHDFSIGNETVILLAEVDILAVLEGA